MMVRPEAIKASKAPSAKPLNNCETKLAQVIMAASQPTKRTRRQAAAHRGAAGPEDGPRRRRDLLSGIGAEIATERVRLLHQSLARDDFEDLPVILLVLHVARLLAADDDHRPHQLMV